MKILAINGSHKKKNSYTSILLQKLFEGAKAENAECEEIKLSEMEINKCMACDVCSKENHYLKCVYDEKDSWISIYEKMKTADIIIYATPVYVMNMSGALKVFFDRMYSKGDCEKFEISDSGLFFHHFDREACQTPFVTLITQDSFEDETSSNITSYFKSLSKFQDTPWVGNIIRRNGILTGWGQNKVKEDKFPKIHESYNAIVQAGKELATIGKITKKTEKIASQDIIPVPGFSVLKRFLPFKKKMLEIMTRLQKQEKAAAQEA